MNEPLQVFDRVELLSMPNDPDSIPVGTKGTVQEKCNFNGIVYKMKWDDGRTLSLIEGVDSWKKL